MKAILRIILIALALSVPGAPAVHTTAPATKTPAPAPAGLLQDIRAARHAGYDRLVFEFGGSTPPAHRIRYVGAVHADPSDRPVPLLGRAFLQVTVQDATLDTAPREPDPSKARRYTGPRRITPRLPLLREVAVAGDFEGVVTFGVGLDHPAGITISTLTTPARLVIDFWYRPPRQPLWPATTVSQAWELQRAADQGHQPWLCTAPTVVSAYAQARLGMAGPVVTALTPAVYQVESDTGTTAVVLAYQPARTGGPCGVWMVGRAAS
jgi:hypothetical protein